MTRWECKPVCLNRIRYVLSGIGWKGTFTLQGLVAYLPAVGCGWGWITFGGSEGCSGVNADFPVILGAHFTNSNSSILERPVALCRWRNMAQDAEPRVERDASLT
jgi:hypothetical protein